MSWSLEKQEPISIQSDTPLPSIIFPDQSLPAESSTLSKEDSFPLCCANESDAGGKLRVLPPKRKARLPLIKELGLDRVAKETPQKNKLYDRIQTKESVLCELGKKYMRMNLKEFGH